MTGFVVQGHKLAFKNALFVWSIGSTLTVVISQKRKRLVRAAQVE